MSKDVRREGRKEGRHGHVAVPRLTASPFLPSIRSPVPRAASRFTQGPPRLCASAGKPFSPLREILPASAGNPPRVCGKPSPCTTAESSRKFRGFPRSPARVMYSLAIHHARPTTPSRPAAPGALRAGRPASSGQARRDDPDRRRRGHALGAPARRAADGRSRCDGSHAAGDPRPVLLPRAKRRGGARDQPAVVRRHAAHDPPHDARRVARADGVRRRRRERASEAPGRSSREPARGALRCDRAAIVPPKRPHTASGTTGSTAKSCSWARP